MVATSDYEPRFWYFFRKAIKGIDHELETLVGSPFSKGKDSVYRSPAHREVGKFWTTSENSVRTEMDVIATILVVQDLAISRHQH